MPLQPPSPEFLAAAPGPEPEHAAGNSKTDRGPGRPGWSRPAGVAGATLVVLAVVGRVLRLTD